MRKQTKLVAVLSAAALLAIGASMTSFAETPHWDQEDGEWIYLDRNGDKVAGEWKKSNGQWYYLDEDGYMAKDLLIDYNDDRFYVDPNGVKVTNTWVAMDNDDLADNEDISTVWFYFDGKGKAVGYGDEDGKVIKKLPYGNGQSGYFIFDDNGVMASDWTEYDGNYYFLGDENQGWAVNGWQYLYTDNELFDGGDEDGNPYEDEEWFYFDSKGKAQKGKNKEIGGKWYAFDNNGIMMDLWVYGTKSGITNADGTSTSSVAATDPEARARYHEEGNGGRDKNWIYAYAKTDYDDYDESMSWFYLDTKGRPVIAKSEDCDSALDWSDNGVKGTSRTVVAKSIKNKTYIFDDAGRMRTGLFQLDDVVKGNGAVKLNGYYYFNEEDGSAEGQMVANKKVTVEIDNEDTTYYFSKTGEAYTNTIISGSLYGDDAKLVTGYGDGSTYSVVDASLVGNEIHEKGKKATIPANAKVLLNGNGKIKKSGTVTDVDGLKVTVKNYIVTEVKDEDKNPISVADFDAEGNLVGYITK